MALDQSNLNLQVFSITGVLGVPFMYSGTFVIDQLKGLAWNGIENYVLAPVPYNPIPWPSHYRHFKNKAKFEKNDFSVICRPRYLRSPRRTRITHFFEIKFFKRMAEKFITKFPQFRIVHGHFISPEGLTAAHIGKKFKVPSVVTIWEETFNSYPLSVVKKTLNEVDAVVAVSKEVIERIHSVHVLPKHLENIPNSVDVEKFVPPKSKEDAKRKFGFPLDKLIIGFVGTFDNRKGVLRLSAAAKNLDVYIALAGLGPLDPKLNHNNILFKNIIEPKNLPRFLQALDIFCFPTINEGMPTVVLEAIASGLPVVSSCIPSVHDILGDTGNILVDPLEIKAIENALQQLIENDDLRDSLSKENRKLALKYDYKVIGSKYVELYERLIT